MDFYVKVINENCSAYVALHQPEPFTFLPLYPNDTDSDEFYYE